MNSDMLKGNWEQVKGHVQKKWGELTNDELGTFLDAARL